MSNDTINKDFQNVNDVASDAAILDTSALHEKVKTYYSVTDKENVNLFTEEINRQILISKAKKNTELYKAKHNLFFAPQPDRTASDRAIVATLFTDTMSYPMTEKYDERPDMSSLTLAITFFICVITMVLFVSVKEKKRRKRRQDAINFYNY